jgi:hypothetical protein
LRDAPREFNLLCSTEPELAAKLMLRMKKYFAAASCAAGQMDYLSQSGAAPVDAADARAGGERGGLLYVCR